MYYDSELLASVAGLGSRTEKKGEGEVYVKGPKCLDSLQEIQRMWRKQHPEIRDVFAALGTWNTVKNDLIPILLRYGKETKTIFATCKLLVMITMPPTPGTSNLAQQWETLQTYKEAFMNKDVLATLVNVLAVPLNQDHSSRTEEESQLIELILTLIRNLLHIPDPINSRAVADTRENMHDSLILAFQEAHILELLIVLVGLMDEKKNKTWDVLLLEIFYLILRKETPEGLLEAYTQNQRYSSQAKGQTNGHANGHANGQANGAPNKLAQLMAKEKQNAKARAVANPARHSKFSGVFVTTQVTGGQKVINNPVNLKSAPISGNSVKVRGATGSAKVPLPNEHYVRSSTELKLTLKSFVDQAIAECYNTLLGSLKSDFERETERLLEGDISNYLWLVRFFTGYHFLSQKMDICGRNSDPDEPINVDKISNTLDMLSFKSIMQKCENAYALKKWALLDISVGAITEIINMVHLMSELGGPAMRHVALGLQTNIFYERQLFLDKVVHFVRTFDASKHPKSLLVKLVQLVHVTLEMLEGHGRIYVKKREPKKKDKKDEANGGKATNGTSEKEKEKDTNGTTENGTSEHGANGTTNGTSSEHGTEKPDVEMGDAEKRTETEGERDKAKDSEKTNEKRSAEEGADKDDKEPEENEALQDQAQAVRETRLNFESYLSAFAHNAVISNYTFLLKTFKDNWSSTNHQIISLFESIAKNYTPMFYQLSIFIVFDKILSDSALTSDPQYKEIYTFVNTIVGGFFKEAETNKFMFAAVLFWKTKHECFLMSASGDDDYDYDYVEEDTTTTTDKPTESTKMAEWTGGDDERLKSYFKTYKDSTNAIDLVMASMGAQRTTAEVYKRLDQLGMLTSTHRKIFADIAKEAEKIDTGDGEGEGEGERTNKATPTKKHGSDKRGICQHLACSRGRGPQALAWLQAKAEEAALLRDRFEMEGSEASYPMPPYDLVPVNDEEGKFISCLAKFMALLGFAAPRKGQLAFWRIPATKTFSASALRTRVVDLISSSLSYASLIKKKEEKEKKKRQPRRGEDSESEGENRYEGESDDPEEGRSRKEPEEEEEVQEDRAEEGEDRSSKKKKKKAKKVVEDSDDEIIQKKPKNKKKQKDSDDEEEEEETSKKSKKTKKDKKTKKSKESDEEESEEEKSVKKSKKAAEDAKKKKKAKKQEEEEEDEEEEQEEKTKKKKKVRIQEDKDEEETEKSKKKNKKKVRIQEDEDEEEEKEKEKKKKHKKKVDEKRSKRRAEEHEEESEEEKGKKKRKGGEEEEETQTPVKKRLRRNTDDAEESVDIAPPLSPEESSIAEEASADIAESLTFPSSSSLPLSSSLPPSSEPLTFPSSSSLAASLPPSSDPLDPSSSLSLNVSAPSQSLESMEVDEGEEEIVVSSRSKKKRIARIDSDEEDE